MMLLFFALFFSLQFIILLISSRKHQNYVKTFKNSNIFACNFCSLSSSMKKNANFISQSLFQCAIKANQYWLQWHALSTNDKNWTVIEIGQQCIEKVYFNSAFNRCVWLRSANKFHTNSRCYFYWRKSIGHAEENKQQKQPQASIFYCSLEIADTLI